MSHFDGVREFKSKKRCPYCGRMCLWWTTVRKEAKNTDKVEEKYCSYCKKMTPHKVVDPKTDGKGTGRDLRCTKCGSARLGEIQGFDAALM